jgi:serine/threonine protein phosphatase PrpC
MSTDLRAHAATDRGLHHDRNEDSHALTETAEGGRLLLVCDGMGGMGRGDEASRIAVDAIVQAMHASKGLPPDRMRDALRRGDVIVRQELCDPDQAVQPGSTAVMVYVLDGAGHVAWVGDSRAYLFRGGAVVDRTRDHKLVEELVAAGQLTPQEARNSTLAHVVTRALGGRDVSEPPVSVATLGYPWKLQQGDRILVCSDGLTDLVEDEELPGLVAGDDLEEVTKRLISVALERGGHDNITVVLASWDGPSWVEEDHATPLMQGPREISPLGMDPSDLSYDGLENAGRVTEEIDVAALAEVASQEADVHLDPADDDTTAALPPPPPPAPERPSPAPWWTAAAALLLLALIAGLVALSS